ncbi:hypothetical protein [Spirosoma arcticum]
MSAEIIIQRLRKAQTSELSQIRADYDAYLATLTTDEQKQVINQVEPVLRELMHQSANRLEEAVASYLIRSPKQVAI